MAIWGDTLETQSRFMLRMAEIELAGLLGAWTRCERLHHLFLDHAGEVLQHLNALDCIDHPLNCVETERRYQDELIEDGRNLLQNASLLDSELRYWSDRWLDDWLRLWSAGRPGQVLTRTD